MGPGTERPGLRFASHVRDGYTVAELSGELDIGCVPTLRGRLLRVLRPGAGNLVVDLSGVTFCDASGLAVLIGTGRRAGRLGGVLRLAAPTPSVLEVIHSLGLHRKLDVFASVSDATASVESSRSPHRVVGAIPGLRPAVEQADGLDGDELRPAIATLLTEIDAWHEADPDGRFTPALQILAGAYAGRDHAALTEAARSLVRTLARHPLTHSPVVAEAASRLRRIVGPGPQS